MGYPVSCVWLAVERSAPMLMEPSAPDAFEPEQPTLSATRCHAEDARSISIGHSGGAHAGTTGFQIG
jgi:hypothetical protein